MLNLFAVHINFNFPEVNKRDQRSLHIVVQPYFTSSAGDEDLLVEAAELLHIGATYTVLTEVSTRYCHNCTANADNRTS